RNGGAAHRQPLHLFRRRPGLFSPESSRATLRPGRRGPQQGSPLLSALEREADHAGGSPPFRNYRLSRGGLSAGGGNLAAGTPAGAGVPRAPRGGNLGEHRGGPRPERAAGGGYPSDPPRRRSRIL